MIVAKLTFARANLLSCVLAVIKCRNDSGRYRRADVLAGHIFRRKHATSSCVGVFRVQNPRNDSLHADDGSLDPAVKPLIRQQQR